MNFSTGNYAGSENGRPKYKFFTTEFNGWNGGQQKTGRHHFLRIVLKRPQSYSLLKIKQALFTNTNNNYETRGPNLNNSRCTCIL